MNIPDKIVIGEHTYRVKMCARVDWMRKDVAGQINYGTKQIKLKILGDKKEVEGTFFHEVAHGMMRELEFNHPRIAGFRNNEDFIQELGLVLRKTFLDLIKTQEGKNED